MNKCSICNSFHDEPGIWCPLCISRFSYATRNMLTNKPTHRCSDCGKPTLVSFGPLCEVCVRKSITKKEIKKSTPIEKEIKMQPKQVNWENLAGLTIITTIIVGVISFIIYSGVVGWIFYGLMYILFDPEALEYAFRFPISVPLIFFSYGLFHHLYYKFYYGGFFNPIRNLKNKIKNKFDDLRLSVKIKYNEHLSRRRSTQAAKRRERYINEQYETTKLLTKLGNKVDESLLNRLSEIVDEKKELDYEVARDFVGENKQSPF